MACGCLDELQSTCAYYPELPSLGGDGPKTGTDDLQPLEDSSFCAGSMTNFFTGDIYEYDDADYDARLLNGDEADQPYDDSEHYDDQVDPFEVDWQAFDVGSRQEPSSSPSIVTSIFGAPSALWHLFIRICSIVCVVWLHTCIFCQWCSSIWSFSVSPCLCLIRASVWHIIGTIRCGLQYIKVYVVGSGIVARPRDIAGWEFSSSFKLTAIPS